MGCVRENNEDNFSINGYSKAQNEPQATFSRDWDDTPLVLAAFDGIGGAAYGEVASKIAADCTLELYKKLSKQTETEPDELVKEYVYE